MDSINISIIKAAWHTDIVASFVSQCTTELLDANQSLTIDEYEVPGVVEIPLFAQKLIEAANPDIIIVVGLIADHGVYRHEFVATCVMDTIMRLQMKTGTPIIYGILTPQDFLSEGREDFFRDHFSLKGKEAAMACLKTMSNISLLKSLPAQAPVRSIKDDYSANGS